MIDRFTDSTIAYQHFGLGININLINSINNFIIKDFKVDFTFLNIVNKNNMIKRLKIRNLLIEYDNFKGNFYQKSPKGFLKLVRKIRESIK